MGYVAVQGGTAAIDNADELARFRRVSGKSLPLTLEQITEQLRFLVDRVMSEGSLYSPFHAALALKQSEGDPLEAAFYLRAYRSTLPRLGESQNLQTEEMRLSRRVSSAFKNIPGGQILGATTDYVQRILDFSLAKEGAEDNQEFIQQFKAKPRTEEISAHCPKVVDLLREQGLVEPLREGTEEIVDITEESAVFPSPRSARLQMLSRGETGGMLTLAYSSMRGYGAIHPTIAELRVGFTPVYITHPRRPQERICLGSLELTEAEVVAKFGHGQTGEQAYLSLGYGLCFGVNEIKAISMAVLDRTMKAEEVTAPAEDQEFVLLHTDGIESSGFCSHFKLPHYITFQSELDRLREVQQHLGEEEQDE